MLVPLPLAGLLVVLAVGQALPSRLIDPQNVKIIGGDETTIEQFPYQVALSYFEKFRCGGSILNENFILTAAHCLADTHFSWHVRGRAGSTLLQKGGQQFKGDKTFYHEQFTEKSLQYDVGLLKLSQPLVLSASVQPVPLVAVGSQPSVGDDIILSGWGVTDSSDSDPASKLRTTTVQVTRHWQCRAAYMLTSKITDRQICAGASGKDSCQGDSGGPAVNSKGQQVGIVSFGLGCAMWPFPGVYTNLANAEIRQYIDGVLKQ